MVAGSNELEALRAAVYLFHLPAGVRAACEQPLPAGLPLLLEVAAGDEAASAACAEQLERPVEVVQQAAEFYVEHVVMKPDADAFRTLAANRDASDGELRRNMAMLLRWAHPDVDRNGSRAEYAGRVTRAWEALKTPDRRTAYEVANPPRQSRRSRSGSPSKQRVGVARDLYALRISGNPMPTETGPRAVLARALRFLRGAG